MNYGILTDTKVKKPTAKIDISVLATVCQIRFNNGKKWVIRFNNRLCNLDTESGVRGYNFI